MEALIRFCTSAEGTPLAYATIGVGPPLLITPGSWESMGSTMELGRGFHEALSLRHTVVRYDRRGTALSDRKRADFTLDSEAEDIRAVVESLGVDRLALMAGFHLGPAALLYAAHHSKRVSQLILYGTYARGSELSSEEVKTSLTTMIRSHWAMASRTLADITSPGVGGEVLERLSRDCKESVDGETVARFVEMGYETDVSTILSEVPVQTLVLHRKKDRAVPFRMSRHLAAGLPNAQLVELEGSIHFPWLGDYQSVLRPIFKFLGDEVPVLEDAAALPSGTAIILFADIVDSTALTEELGDTAFREKARKLDATLRAIIRENNGTPIEGKLLGDGVLAVFTSARDAITAAVRCRDASRDAGLELHLGIHAGDVIREENNVYGGAVNIASRISGLSTPGEVLVSDTVRSLARTSAGVSFEDRGEQALKGVGDAFRVWAVREGDG